MFGNIEDKVIEPGDIVYREDTPGLLFRVWQIQDGCGSFYRVTKSGRRDRRHTGFSGSMVGWALARKCEFPLDSKCRKCGGESPVLTNGRCTSCNPFRACRVQGCLGDLVSRPKAGWMNRHVCDACGVEVSK